MPHSQEIITVPRWLTVTLHSPEKENYLSYYHKVRILNPNFDTTRQCVKLFIYSKRGPYINICNLTK